MEVKVMTTTFSYDQLSTADTSLAQQVFMTKPNIYIMQLFARVKIAFAGVTNPSVELGRTGHTTMYIPKISIESIGDLSTTLGAGNIAPCKRALSYQKTPGNIGINATFRSTSGNLSSLSAGEIEFVCVYVE